jgi:hypothetical protein
MMGSRTRQVVVGVAAAFAAATVVGSGTALAATSTGADDYNGVLTGTTLPPLCQHSTTDDYTNCLVG